MKKHLYQVAVPLILLAVTLYAAGKPYYNWDMFPYMALAASHPSVPFANTHQLVYREASSHMNPADFSAISQRQPELRDNPEAFQGILKYFRIKPGYLIAVRLGYGLGLNLLMATYFPSILSYFLLGWLLFAWIQKSMPLPAAALITLVTASSWFLIQTARYSSPDMLCALMLMSGLFLAVEYSIGMGLLVSGLSIAVRPDAIILYGLVILAFYLANRISLLPAVASAAAGMVLTILIISDPGLFREFLFTDTTFTPAWSLDEWVHHYFTGVKNGLPTILESGTLVFVPLAVLGIYFRHKYHPWTGDLWSLLMMMALAAMVIRYFLHPFVEDRFMIANYLIIVMGLCKTLPYYLTTRPKRTLQ